MIRVVIVDDEELARRGIRARLEDHPGFEVVGEAGAADTAIPLIRSLRPDLVFLDVQMPGPDGLALLSSLGVDPRPEIVFVTAHDEHAVRAFEAEALDYLLKPIDGARFASMLARVERRIVERSEQALGRQVAALVARGAPAPEPAGRLLVRSSGRLIPLATADIDWIEAEGDYVRVHAGGAEHLVRESLAELERRLDAARFARIHRSTIVNVDRIRELQPYFNREYIVILHDGTRLKLSRTYRDRLPPLLGGSG